MTEADYAHRHTVSLDWHTVPLNWHTVPAHGFVVHFMASDIREMVYLEREFLLDYYRN
jgi:hypothetical protein